MDPVVPQGKRRIEAHLTRSEIIVDVEVTVELTQILSNLVLGDNDIRAKCVQRFAFVIGSLTTVCL